MSVVSYALLKLILHKTFQKKVLYYISTIFTVQVVWLTVIYLPLNKTLLTVLLLSDILKFDGIAVSIYFHFLLSAEFSASFK